MAERDRTAVGVHARGVVVEFLLPGHDHRGEGLVDLDHVDVAHAHAGLPERGAGGGDRRGEVPDRVVAQHRQVVDARARGQVVALQRGLGDHQHGAGTGEHDGDHANAIESILTQSRRRNPELGITGVLCHADGVFMQVLEGGREAVNQLYRRICSDTRHTDVILLHYEEITERRFGGWTMGQVNLSKLNTSIVLKYSERPEFDPYGVSGKVSLALLEELMATASIIGRA